jgi:hypothetical protein
VRLGLGRLLIDDGDVRVDVELDEEAGIETVCPTGASYAWTRKQGGIGARGVVALGEIVHRLDARAVIDDTAGYYKRHTGWRWSPPRTAPGNKQPRQSRSAYSAQTPRWRRSAASNSFECMAPIRSRSGCVPDAMICTARSTSTCPASRPSSTATSSSTSGPSASR